MLNISNMGTLYVKHWQKISSILEGALSSRMSPWQRAKGSEKRNTRHFASLLLLYLEDTHRVHKKISACALWNSRQNVQDLLLSVEEKKNWQNINMVEQNVISALKTIDEALIEMDPPSSHIVSIIHRDGPHSICIVLSEILDDIHQHWM